MTDREQNLLDKELEESLSSEDYVLEDARRIPGEEVDPDSLRPVPPVDEEGEVVDPVIDEDDIEHAGRL